MAVDKFDMIANPNPISVKASLLPNGSENVTQENKAIATGNFVATIELSDGSHLVGQGIKIGGQSISFIDNSTPSPSTINSTHGTLTLGKSTLAEATGTTTIPFTYTLTEEVYLENTTDTIPFGINTESLTLTVNIQSELELPSPEVPEVPDVEPDPEPPVVETDQDKISLKLVKTIADNALAKLKANGLVKGDVVMDSREDYHKVICDYAALTLGIIDKPWGFVAPIVEKHLKELESN